MGCVRKIVAAGVLLSLSNSFDASAQTVRSGAPDSTVAAFPLLAAQPLDIPVRTTVPAHEEESSASAPRSSFDYEQAALSASTKAWTSPPPTTEPVLAVISQGSKPWDVAPTDMKAWDVLPQVTIAPAPAAIAEAPAPIRPKPSASAERRSLGAQAFTGVSQPMPCHAAGYHVLVDGETELNFAKLCRRPDGSWQLAP
jgi:hypothetical protein